MLMAVKESDGAPNSGKRAKLTESVGWHRRSVDSNDGFQWSQVGT